MSVQAATDLSESVRSTVANFGKYRLLEPINRGSMGMVYRIQCIRTLQYYALKVVESRHADRVQEEIELQKRAACRHVVRVISSFQDKQNCYMVLELCQMDLKAYQALNPALSESQVRPLLLQMARGLQCIHAQNIIHRDIKPQNIMLDAAQDIKIGDFGFAEVAGSGSAGFCGTLNCIAPEMLDQRGYGQQADLYSLGCVVYWLLVGRLPTRHTTYKEAIQKLPTQKIEIPETLSIQSKTLLMGLLRKDPKARLTIDQVLDHPFFQSSATDRIRRSLGNVVNQRLSIPCHTLAHVTLREDETRGRLSLGGKENCGGDRERRRKTASQRTETCKDLPIIDTEGLPPATHETAQGQIQIHQDGALSKTLSTGQTIKIHKASITTTLPSPKTYSPTTLPLKYQRIYLYLHQIVQVLRKNTACRVMETPLGRFVVYLDGRREGSRGSDRVLWDGQWVAEVESGEQQWIAGAKHNLELLGQAH